MKKILFVGAANLRNSPKGGEEFKNQILIRKLREEFKLNICDTYKWKKKPLTMLRLFMNVLFVSYDKILISASSISSYKLIKFIYYCTRKQPKTIYFVIGGYFPQGVLDGVFEIKYYKNRNYLIFYLVAFLVLLFF